MIKQIILLSFLLIGIVGTVLVVQKSTIWKSFGYDILDFSYFFHASENDPRFNPNLDIYKDGTINTLDVLKDRYAQEATRSGTTGDVSNIMDSSGSGEASGSAN